MALTRTEQARAARSLVEVFLAIDPTLSPASLFDLEAAVEDGWLRQERDRAEQLSETAQEIAWDDGHHEGARETEDEVEGIRDEISWAIAQLGDLILDGEPEARAEVERICNRLGEA